MVWDVAVASVWVGVGRCGVAGRSVGLVVDVVVCICRVVISVAYVGVADERWWSVAVVIRVGGWWDVGVVESESEGIVDSVVGEGSDGECICVIC